MDTEKEIVYLQLEDIIPNRFQPREVFDENSLKELAVSIKEHGVIQPIIVRKVDDKYEIIAGERRYKAAALADLKKIPAIVRDIDDKESSKVTLLENLQRKNLNPMEEARTYQKILDLDQMTQEELAKTMGKSQSAVANKLRLLALPKKVQDALMNEQISERHARALLNLEDDSKKEELLDKIIATKMTVRELEKTINKLNTQSSGIDDLEENLPEVPIEEPQDSTTNDIPEEEGEAEPVPNLPTDDLQEQFTSDLPAEEENQEIPDVPIAEDGNDASVDITKPQEESVDVGVNSFINSDLITPDTEDKKTDKEYGEVTYAPPEGEEESQTGLPKFINYGEIDDDEDDGEEEKNLATSTSIDINDLKENTADINTEEIKKKEDIDDLLKVDPNAKAAPEPTVKEDGPGFKFINPEESKEKEEKPEVEEKTIIDNPMDYFTSPDVIPTADSADLNDNNQKVDEADNNTAIDDILNGSGNSSNYREAKFDENGDFVDDDGTSTESPEVGEKKEDPYIYIPDSIKDKAALTSILMSDGVETSESKKTEPISLKEAIDEIRQTVSKLEKGDVGIETEEIDLPNNYQINIKIRKDEEN